MSLSYIHLVYGEENHKYSVREPPGKITIYNARIDRAVNLFVRPSTSLKTEIDDEAYFKITLRWTDT
jgi:hypothetical protein